MALANKDQVFGQIRHGLGVLGTWLASGGAQAVLPQLPKELTIPIGSGLVALAAVWSFIIKSDGSGSGGGVAGGNDPSSNLGLAGARPSERTSGQSVVSVILGLCLLTAGLGVTGTMITGCGTTAQAKAEQSLAGIAQAKKLALKAWAEYVVSREDKAKVLPTAECEAALAKLQEDRAKVQEADRAFQLAWNIAFNAAEAGSVASVPADVAARWAEIQRVIKDITGR